MPFLSPNQQHQSTEVTVYYFNGTKYVHYCNCCGTKTDSLRAHCSRLCSKHYVKCIIDKKSSYLSTFRRHARQISITERRLRSLSSLSDDVPCYHWNPFLSTKQMCMKLLVSFVFAMHIVQLCTKQKTTEHKFMQSHKFTVLFYRLYTVSVVKTRHQEGKKGRLLLPLLLLLQV